VAAQFTAVGVPQIVAVAAAGKAAPKSERASTPVVHILFCFIPTSFCGPIPVITGYSDAIIIESAIGFNRKARIAP